jgi:tetratricopeptide (TPR) repeat protein
MRRRLRCTAIVVLLLAPASAAFANGADDGNRGLQAMQQNDYDGAIADFTHALKYGHLEGDDQEFAYANRGRAYLRKGDTSLAIADLDRARQMKPDDADAQNDMLTALQTVIPPDQIPDKPHMGFFEALGRALLQGIVAGIAQAAAQQQQQQ